jgi:hypothetical protein
MNDCASCSNAAFEWLDGAWPFELDSTVYVDQPLAGWAQCLACRQSYVFRCTPIVPQYLWHWVFVPTQSTEPFASEQHSAEDDSDDDEALRLLNDFRSEAALRWLSVVEDRRAGGLSRFHAVWLNTGLPQVGQLVAKAESGPVTRGRSRPATLGSRTRQEEG